MTTVELHNLILHGYHGVFEEEKKVMNTFEVNLSVRFDERKSDFNRLEDTISYVDLYKIVRNKTQAPALLLETLCQGIIRKIKQQYPRVTEVTISIFKMQAPIENFQGKVGITMKKKFDD